MNNELATVKLLNTDPNMIHNILIEKKSYVGGKTETTIN